MKKKHNQGAGCYFLPILFAIETCDSTCLKADKAALSDEPKIVLVRHMSCPSDRFVQRCLLHIFWTVVVLLLYILHYLGPLPSRKKSYCRTGDTL